MPRWRCHGSPDLFLLITPAAHAEVLRLADMNTTQLRALDRTKMVVLMTGGMLEEHGLHVHGSPHHIRALDDAGDFFRDTCGGRMVNLWG